MNCTIRLIKPFMVHRAAYQQQETGHETHLAFFLMGYLSLPLAYSDRYVTLYIQSHLALRLKKEEIYITTPLWIIVTYDSVSGDKVFILIEGFQDLTICPSGMSDIR